MYNDFNVVTDIFRIVGHSDRIRVLQALESGPCTVSALTRQVYGANLRRYGQVSAILVPMRKTGLVTSLRQRRTVIYSLTGLGRSMLDSVRKVQQEIAITVS